MTITGNGGPLAPGYHFMTLEGYTGAGFTTAKENGGFIMTSDGDLVYGFANEGLTDLRKQLYNGKEYLTYWSGFSTAGVNTGHGYGQVTFLDTTYRSFVVDVNLGLKKLVQMPMSKWSTNFHEQQMTERNTLLVTAYNNSQHDLSSVGSLANGWIVDGMVFELDVARGKVLFNWRASEHVPLSASHISQEGNGTKAAPWDWFHINSIQAVGPNYLVGSRHCWTIYLVSGADGSIIWSLEGERGGSFGALPVDGTFRWQHFVRAYNVTGASLDLSIFDNHNAEERNGIEPTKGLLYHLELPASKSYAPKLIRKIETPSEELYSLSQGSYDPALSNGNQLMGYGQIAITREYGPATDGSDLRWEAQFGTPNAVQSYRAFRDTWCATPADWDPRIVVENATAYVSWNGATQVESWAVFTGTSKSNLREIGVAVRKGFETVFDVPSGTKYVQVAAVQAGVQVRKSNIAAV